MEKKSNIYNVRAERFKQAIKESGYTQKCIAERLNYSESAISAYCNGTRQITIESAYRLSQLLDIRIEYLMGEDDNKTAWDAYQAAVDFDQPAWLLSELIAWYGIKTHFEMKAVDEITVNYIESSDMPDQNLKEKLINECLEKNGLPDEIGGKRKKYKPISRYTGCEFTTLDGRKYMCDSDQLKELIQDIFDYAEMRIQKKMTLKEE